MQQNAGSLLLSGVSALLSTTGSSKSEKKKDGAMAAKAAATGEPAATSLGLTDILSLGSGLIPIAWEVAQPFLITWGIKRVKKMMSHLFTRKKKQP